MLYLVELPEADVQHCMCSDLDHKNKCAYHINMKLDTRLKIPLRNSEMVLNTEGDARMSLCSSGTKRKRCIKLKPKDHKFKIVNSCNGFLCLSEPLCNDPVVVCNPVTGEYINLPMAKNVDENREVVIDCGLGFSPKTAQYKVIRMFDQGTPQSVNCPVTGKKRYYSRVAEIHTLGTASWKSVGFGPFSIEKLTIPTYLNGALHWLCIDFEESYFFDPEYDYPDFIVSLDMDSERFKSFPSPPLKHDIGLIEMQFVSLGVVRNRLCFCDGSGDDPINIWVMEKYGVGSSWTKLISIGTSTAERWCNWLYRPINQLKNGPVLMYHYPQSAVIYYDPKRKEWKYLKICGIKSKFEAVSHVPSLVSLKDAMMGDNDTVLNIKSRCDAGVKLLGETKGISLVEEDIETDPDSDFISYSDGKWSRNWWQTSLEKLNKWVSSL